MTKNEIVARWNGVEMYNGLVRVLDQYGDIEYDSCFEYPLNYEALHEAWVKFRDLKTSERDSDAHSQWKQTIGYSILNKPIGSSFDLLVKGIEWHNSLKK